MRKCDVSKRFPSIEKYQIVKQQISDIRLLSNPGLQHLAMVLHALDVLSERLSIGHGDIDVPFTEDSIAGHV